MKKTTAWALICLSVLWCGTVATAATKAQSVQFLLSQVRTSTTSLAGGKVYFYTTGTSTPLPVWVDRDKSALAVNPYTLDANGTASVFADGIYRIVIKDAAGVTKYDRQGLPFFDDATSFATAAQGAKADTYTAADVLAKIKTVDGASSGLDADLLDGQHGAYYGVPVGAVMAFAMDTCPSGWLAGDTQIISRTTYSNLYAAIGTTYGVGDGTSTFQLPDYRGEFLRGYDAGRGVDTGHLFGSFQADELKSHTHTYSSQGGGFNATTQGSPTAITSPTTSTSSATGGTETRPRNVSVRYCIKY